MSATIIALLSFAVWRDVATRTIPNAVSAALLIAGSIARLCDGWEALGTSLLVAVSLLLVLVPFCIRGWIGGADLKLLAALAAGLSPAANWQLLSNVAICGGILAALYLCLRHITVSLPTPPRPVARNVSLFGRIAAIELWRIQRHGPLPYGAAIAAGAVLAIMQHQGM